MPRTVGYHLVKSGYGLWLPGDDRGSWSAAWDEQLGFIEPHQLHPGDPVRKRMAAERMKHPPMRLTPAMIEAVADAIGQCAADSPWRVAAASIEPTHMHLLITYSGIDIDRTRKWLAQNMTRAVHERTPHRGPVWCENWWRGFVFDDAVWDTTQRYIEKHNIRRGDAPSPWPFIAP
jgi:REP element-mobilizing transposase RayT